MHKMPSSPTVHTNDTSEQEMSPWRISRIPGSVITFASFDPSTATGSGNETNEAAMRKLSLNEELCRPKRVVIEASPDGRSTWRFVPRARWEEGVENEGSWPREVDVCGKMITLTQDHWDMYKLDRRYDCLVRLSPMLTVVRKTRLERSPEPPPNSAEGEGSAQSSSLRSRDVRFTRAHLSNHVKRRASASKVGMEKKARTAPSGYSSSSSDSSSEDDTADEDEVDKLVNEGGASKQDQAKKQYQASARLLKVRANIEEARRRRRDLAARRKAQLGSIAELKDEDVEMASCSEAPFSTPSRAKSMGAAPVKRKASDGHISDPPAETSDHDHDSDRATRKRRFRSYDKVGQSKRIRAVSPASAQRALRNRRSEWWRTRYDRSREEARQRMEEREKKQMEELFAEAAQREARLKAEAAQRDELSRAEAAQREAKVREEAARRETRARAEARTGKASGSSSHQQPMPGARAEEEARRQDMLEESRLKIAELEKDRHLWEEQARKRAAAEAEAKERIRVEATQKARAASESRSAAEKEERAKRQADAERRERENAAAELHANREKARRAALRDGNAWTRRGWTVRAALERYQEQSEAFDKLNFFRGDVVVFETIPWPVLKRPNSFGVEDIDWSTVEAFFKGVSVYLNAEEYAKLVEKSHKRFHPDRWRSRRVLTSVEDEEEKECLEVAANTVAQAITPLWQDVTGR